MKPILSLLFVLVMVVLAITLVMALGLPLIESEKENAKFRATADAFRALDEKISEVAIEPEGSSRVIRLYFSNDVTINNDIKSEFHIGSIMNYLSRKVMGNVEQISGEVACSVDSNIVMENSYLKAVFQRIDKTEPLSDINTKNTIISLTEKFSDKEIIPEDTSIVIDDIAKSSYGKGYTELLSSGPVCTVRMHVESSVAYDVYYKLYSGADFLTIEVANILEK
ncbi:MAG: hypothetical protein V1802_01685 [Candidatus Aenigmatarchaeota archaeon]